MSEEVKLKCLYCQGVDTLIKEVDMGNNYGTYTRLQQLKNLKDSCINCKNIFKGWKPKKPSMGEE